MERSIPSGRVHSIQTLGTLDGPGVRFVVFTQGCPLRCSCCHNPDTWDADGGVFANPLDLVSQALRYREYFGVQGGVTVSGGEPLLQADFCTAFFLECHKNALHTCLDTSGCILNDRVKALLCHTDRVLLDIKYPTDELYRKHVGCSLDAPLSFLNYLNEQGIPTTLRQVIIPSLNDTKESIRFLAELFNTYSCVDDVELLPFRKICTVKYERLSLPFPLATIPEPSPGTMEALEELLNTLIR